MRPTLKVAIAAVVLLSLAVAAGVVAYLQRPLPKPGVAHLRIAYAMLMPGPPTVPHLSMVKEVVSAFKSWYEAKTGVKVVVSVDYVEMVELRKEIGIGKPKYDVWWGGLAEAFEDEKEYLLPFNSTQKDVLLSLVPNGTVLNCPIMDLEGPTPTWYAWCLYAPCLLYDPSTLPEVPSSWEELASPRLENQVIVPNFLPEAPTDPFLKHVCLVIYASEAWRLGNESLGWGAAWNTSVVLWAIVEDLSDAPFIDALRVVAGDKWAMLCSDILAYHMLIEAGYSGLAVRYLNASLLFPCPVAVLKGAENEEVAKAFVDFLLSAEGQSIVARHLMPIRPDVSPSPPVISPFSPQFPGVKEFNETFLRIGAEFVYDYVRTWLVEHHRPQAKGSLRTAWWWIKRANETKEANENATRYFNYAWANFTAMSRYVSRADFDTIYNETDAWTDKASVLAEWRRAAEAAFTNATECARRSIELAENATAQSQPAPGWPGSLGPGKGLSERPASPRPEPCPGREPELGCSWPVEWRPRSPRYPGDCQ